MPSPCCPRTPEEAGATTVAQLLEMARRSPDLRPCTKYRGSQGTMQWIHKTTCLKCDRYIPQPEASDVCQD
jgi:hypothetical protein